MSSILFLCFINNIISVQSVVIGWLFADDLKIATRVQGSADALRMQEVLLNLHHWYQDNLMELNLSKCKVMLYHLTKNPYIHQYTLADFPISRFNQMKYLGVTFNHDLNITHFDNIRKKSLQSLGFLYRHTQDFRKPKTLRVLYYVYERSGLEYVL